MKKLGFGLMRLPYSSDEKWGHIDIKATKKMIDTYMAQGFTYFDTAYVYHGGYSEKVFGKLVASRYPRNKFQVTTKMPLWGMKEEKELDKIFKEQLKRCKVEYFDYYFLHALNADVYKKAEDLHAFEFLKRMKKEGKIKHIGFSFHDKPAVLKKILAEHKEVELVQLQVNYYDWTGTNVFAKQCMKIAQDAGKKIAIMEPLHGGDLAKLTPAAEKILTDYNPEASVASWGIRFAAGLDKVMVVLSGMSNQEQLEDNMSYMKKFVPLSKQENSKLNKALKIIRETIAIPCTACRYCVDGCPKKISIPDYFRLYNQQNQFSLTGPIKWNYSETKKRGGKPADCIKCGQCEKHCPQKIKIIETLEMVRKTFEPK